MKFILEINNQTKYKFSKKFFMDVFRRTVGLADLKCLGNKTLELSIALVKEDEIRTLNNRYRKKDSVTDVLSFCEFESKDDLCKKNKNAKEEQIFLGELILCPSYISCNAKEDDETLDDMLKYITAHGILHLLGFDHNKKMFSLQALVVEQMAV